MDFFNFAQTHPLGGRGGGDGCHLRVVPPGQLHRRPSTPKCFCLSAVFIEPGLSIFCVVKFLSHVFFVFAFRWFRVFHRGCYVYFPIVFSSNSLYILYIFIFIYFLIYFFIVQWILRSVLGDFSGMSPPD